MISLRSSISDIRQTLCKFSGSHAASRDEQEWLQRLSAHMEETWLFWVNLSGDEMGWEAVPIAQLNVIQIVIEDLANAVCARQVLPPNADSKPGADLVNVYEQLRRDMGSGKESENVRRLRTRLAQRKPPTDGELWVLSEMASLKCECEDLVDTLKLIETQRQLRRH